MIKPSSHHHTVSYAGVRPCDGVMTAKREGSRWTTTVELSAWRMRCAWSRAGNESGICGRPATVAHAWPYTPRIPDPPTPGLWAMQPVCGQCAQEMAALYSAA